MRRQLQTTTQTTTRRRRLLTSEPAATEPAAKPDIAPGQRRLQRDLAKLLGVADVADLLDPTGRSKPAAATPEKPKRHVRKPDDYLSFRAMFGKKTLARLEEWDALDAELHETLVEGNLAQRVHTGRLLSKSKLRDQLLPAIMREHRRFRKLPVEVAQQIAKRVYTQFKRFTATHGDERVLKRSTRTHHRFYMARCILRGDDGYEILYFALPKLGLQQFKAKNDGSFGAVLRGRIKGAILQRGRGGWSLKPSFARGKRPAPRRRKERGYDPYVILEIIDKWMHRTGVEWATAAELLPVLARHNMPMNDEDLAWYAVDAHAAAKPKKIAGKTLRRYSAKRIRLALQGVVYADEPEAA